MSRPSILRLLKSRTLAVVLLLVLVGWTAVATLAGTEGESVAATLGSVLRAVGVRDMYASPIFYVLVCLVALSTATCAWERTATALRRLRALGSPSEAALRGVAEHPTVTVAVPGDGDLAPSRVAAAFSRAHFGVTESGSAVQAARGRIGLIGSPLFHWTLVALIVLIAAGRLTRMEGLMGIPVGSSTLEVAESYNPRNLDEGALYPGHTGLRIEASEFAEDYMDGDVGRGPSPVIALFDGETKVAEDRVYPNHPLRYRSLMIHSDDYGFAPVVVLRDPSGTEIVRETPLVDFAEDPSSGTLPVAFDLLDDAGDPVLTVELRVLLPSDPAAAGSLALAAELTDLASGSVLSSAVLKPGDSLVLPDGSSLALESIGPYTRISVADDWSVPYLYGLFVLATLGISLAVLVSARRVIVLLDDADGTMVLKARTWHARSDPGFDVRIRAILERAAGIDVADEGEA